MIDSAGRMRQLIEILAQDLARQENLADAKASQVNLGCNEGLISFVLLGLADVSDWRLVDIATQSGGGVLGDEDFRAHCLWCWNRKCDLVTDGNVRGERAGQQEFCLIRKQAGGGIRLALDAHHTLAVYRDGRA